MVLGHVGEDACDVALLERDAELVAVAAALEHAAGGRGQLLLIEGPPGIGKTTLLRRTAAAAAQEGFVVLRAAGAELERGFAFGVVRQLLERAVRERPAAGGAAALGAALLRDGPDAVAPGPEAVFAALHGLY